jgi:hypothetical protein
MLLLPAPAIFAFPARPVFAFMLKLALLVEMLAPVPVVDDVLVVVVVVVDVLVTFALLAFSVDVHPTPAVARASTAERARVLRIDVFLLLPSGWLFIRFEPGLAVNE